jgi:hypothetical protein
MYLFEYLFVLLGKPRTSYRRSTADEETSASAAVEQFHIVVREHQQKGQ